MADVSTITNPSTGTTYNIKDATARGGVSTLTNNESYDRQLLNGTYEGRNILTALGVSTFDAAVAAMHTLATSRNAGELRLGDYIDVKPTVSTVNKGANIRYRIAGIGHCYQFGDQSCPWAFWMVPDAPIDMTGSTYAINTSYIYWNTTATNNGTAEQPMPYLASNLHKWELEQFVPAMPTSLQNVMVNHRILFEKRYSAGGALEESTDWGWGDAGKAFSLSETEVYGQCVWGTKGWSVGADAQLPLFALEPRRRLSGNRVYRWLRSVRAGSTSIVCYVSNTGLASSGSATYTSVRPWPCFLLG